MATTSGKPQHYSKQRKDYEAYLKSQKQITIRATGKVITGVYNIKLIGWDTADGFYSVGDAFQN